MAAPLLQTIPAQLLQEEKLLGVGGYGQVFLVNCLGNKYALKKFNSTEKSTKAVEEYLKEAEMVAKLDSKYLVKIHGKVANPPGLLLEYMNAGDLSSFIHDNSQELTLQVKKQILHDVACGLNFLHTNGVAHQDIKPANVMLSRTKSSLCAKIGDLDTAKRILQTHLTLSGSSAAPFSIFHGAPETFNPRDKKTNLFKRDIYSFGILAYELLTGKAPYADEFYENMLYFAMSVAGGHRPAFSGQEPSAWRELIEKCWDSNPEKRPSSSTLLRMVEELPVPNHSNLSMVIDHEPTEHSVLDFEGYGATKSYGATELQPIGINHQPDPEVIEDDEEEFEEEDVEHVESSDYFCVAAPIIAAVGSVALIVTAILGALYLDEFLGSSASIWLAPFFPLGFCVSPLVLFLVMGCGALDGQWPLLSCIHDVTCLPCTKNKVRTSRNASIILRAVHCCFKASYLAKFNKNIDLTFGNQVVVHLLCIPAMCIGVAVKLILFRKLPVWSYVFIPTYCCWALTSLENIVTATRMMVITGRIHTQVYHIASSVTLALAFLVTGLSTAFSLGRLDGWHWIQETPYAVTFIGFYMAPLLFFIAAMLFSLRVWLPVLHENKWGKIVLVAGALLLPLLICAYATGIMLAARLEGSNHLLFSYVMIPVEAAGALVCVYVAVLAAVGIYKFAKGIPCSLGLRDNSYSDDRDACCSEY